MMAFKEPKKSDEFLAPANCSHRKVDEDVLKERGADAERIVCGRALDVHFEVNKTADTPGEVRKHYMGFNWAKHSPACPYNYTGRFFSTEQEHADLCRDPIAYSRALEKVQPYDPPLYKKHDPRKLSKTVVVRDYGCKIPVDVASTEKLAKAVLNHYPDQYAAFLGEFVSNCFGENMRKYLQVQRDGLQKLLEEQTELNRTSWTIYKAVVGDIRDQPNGTGNRDYTLNFDGELERMLSSLARDGRAMTGQVDSRDVYDLRPCLMQHVQTLSDMINKLCRGFGSSEESVLLMLSWCNDQGRNLCSDLRLLSEHTDQPDYDAVRLHMPLSLVHHSHCGKVTIPRPDMNTCIPGELVDETEGSTSNVSRVMTHVASVGNWAGKASHSQAFLSALPIAEHSMGWGHAANVLLEINAPTDAEKAAAIAPVTFLGGEPPYQLVAGDITAILAAPPLTRAAVNTQIQTHGGPYGGANVDDASWNKVYACLSEVQGVGNALLNPYLRYDRRLSKVKCTDVSFVHKDRWEKAFLSAGGANAGTGPKQLVADVDKPSRMGIRETLQDTNEQPIHPYRGSTDQEYRGAHFRGMDDTHQAGQWNARTIAHAGNNKNILERAPMNYQTDFPLSGTALVQTTNPNVVGQNCQLSYNPYKLYSGQARAASDGNYSLSFPFAAFGPYRYADVKARNLHRSHFTQVSSFTPSDVTYATWSMQEGAWPVRYALPVLDPMVGAKELARQIPNAEWQKLAKCLVSESCPAEMDGIRSRALIQKMITDAVRTGNEPETVKKLKRVEPLSNSARVGIFKILGKDWSMHGLKENSRFEERWFQGPLLTKRYGIDRVSVYYNTRLLPLAGAAVHAAPPVGTPAQVTAIWDFFKNGATPGAFHGRSQSIRAHIMGQAAAVGLPAVVGWRQAGQPGANATKDQTIAHIRTQVTGAIPGIWADRFVAIYDSNDWPGLTAATHGTYAMGAAPGGFLFPAVPGGVDEITRAWIERNAFLFAKEMAIFHCLGVDPNAPVAGNSTFGFQRPGLLLPTEEELDIIEHYHSKWSPVKDAAVAAAPGGPAAAAAAGADLDAEMALVAEGANVFPGKKMTQLALDVVTAMRAQATNGGTMVIDNPLPANDNDLISRNNIVKVLNRLCYRDLFRVDYSTLSPMERELFEPKLVSGKLQHKFTTLEFHEIKDPEMQVKLQVLALKDILQNNMGPHFSALVFHHAIRKTDDEHNLARMLMALQPKYFSTQLVLTALPSGTRLECIKAVKNTLLESIRTIMTTAIKDVNAATLFNNEFNAAAQELYQIHQSNVNILGDTEHNKELTQTPYLKELPYDFYCGNALLPAMENVLDAFQEPDSARKEMKNVRDANEFKEEVKKEIKYVLEAEKIQHSITKMMYNLDQMKDPVPEKDKDRLWKDVYRGPEDTFRAAPLTPFPAIADMRALTFTEMANLGQRHSHVPEDHSVEGLMCPDPIQLKQNKPYPYPPNPTAADVTKTFQALNVVANGCANRKFHFLTMDHPGGVQNDIPTAAHQTIFGSNTNEVALYNHNEGRPQLFAMLDASALLWVNRSYFNPADCNRPAEAKTEHGQVDDMHYWCRTYVESFAYSRAAHKAKYDKDIRRYWELDVKLNPQETFPSSMIGSMTDDSFHRLFPLLPKQSKLSNFRDMLRRMRALEVLWGELPSYSPSQMGSAPGAWMPVPVSHQMHLYKMIGLFDTMYRVPRNCFLAHEGKGLARIYNQSYHSVYRTDSWESRHFHDWKKNACRYQVPAYHDKNCYYPFSQYGGTPVEADFVHHRVEKCKNDAYKLRHAQLVRNRFCNTEPLRIGQQYHDTGLLQDWFNFEYRPYADLSREQRTVPDVDAVYPSNFLAYARQHAILALASCNPGTEDPSMTRIVRNLFRMHVDTYECMASKPDEDGVPAIMGFMPVPSQGGSDDRPIVLYAGSLVCMNTKLERFCASEANLAERVCQNYKQVYLNDATLLFMRLLRKQYREKLHNENFNKAQLRRIKPYSRTQFDRDLIDLQDSYIDFLQQTVLSMLIESGADMHNVPLHLLEPRELEVSLFEEDDNMTGNDYLTPRTQEILKDMDFGGPANLNRTQLSILSLIPPNNRILGTMQFSQANQVVDFEHLRKEIQKETLASNKKVWKRYTDALISAAFARKLLEVDGPIDYSFDMSAIKDPLAAAAGIPKAQFTSHAQQTSSVRQKLHAEQLRQNSGSHSVLTLGKRESEEALRQVRGMVEAEYSRMRGTVSRGKILANLQGVPYYMKRMLKQDYE